jgi:hypothetical protein
MTKEKIETIHIFSAEDLKALYDDSALTITGLKVDSIPDFVKWVESYTKLLRRRAYVVSGKVMNVYCGLTGDNAYQDDLNLVAIKLSDIADYSKIVLPRFLVGGRWFDDIVDNNRRHEEEKIADELNDDDFITINED